MKVTSPLPLDQSGAKWMEERTHMPDIWEYLITKYRIRSVIDVGCGHGAAVKWFTEHGMVALGVDGCREALDRNHAAKSQLVEHDYRDGPYRPSKRYDFAWCSEFVEHVPESSTQHFIETFKWCRYVCLTHAVPGQGGCCHVNEQNTEYWVNLLAKQGLIWDAKETMYLRSSGPSAPYGRNTLTWFINRN